MPDFKIIRKGYDTLEVNRYIEKLQKEIDEFKAQEGYINKAIISAEQAASKIKENAQKEADEALSKAKSEAQTILANANSESEKLLAKTHNQLELIRRREKDKLEDVKVFVGDQIDYLNKFKSEYQALAKKYFETYPSEGEFNKLMESLNNITGLIDSFENPEKEP